SGVRCAQTDTSGKCTVVVSSSKDRVLAETRTTPGRIACSSMAVQLRLHTSGSHHHSRLLSPSSRPGGLASLRLRTCSSARTSASDASKSSNAVATTAKYPWFVLQWKVQSLPEG